MKWLVYVLFLKSPVQEDYPCHVHFREAVSCWRLCDVTERGWAKRGKSVIINTKAEASDRDRTIGRYCSASTQTVKKKLSNNNHEQIVLAPNANLPSRWFHISRQESKIVSCNFCSLGFSHPVVSAKGARCGHVSFPTVLASNTESEQPFITLVVSSCWTVIYVFTSRIFCQCIHY